MTGGILNRGKGQCYYRYFPGALYLHDGIYVIVASWDSDGILGIDRDTVMAEIRSRARGFIASDPLPPNSRFLSFRELLGVRSSIFPQVFHCSVCNRIVHSLDAPEDLVRELRAAEQECGREGHRFFPRQFRFVSVDPCGFIGEGYDPDSARCPRHPNAPMRLRTGQSERVSNFRWVCTVPRCGTELPVTGIRHNCISREVIQHKSSFDPPRNPRGTQIQLASKNIVSLPEVFTRVNLQDPRRLEIKGLSNWQARVLSFLIDAETYVTPDLLTEIRTISGGSGNPLVEAIATIARTNPEMAEEVRRGLRPEQLSEEPGAPSTSERAADEMLDFLLAVNQPPTGLSRSLMTEHPELSDSLRVIGVKDVILLEKINLTTVLYGYSRGEYQVGDRMLRHYPEDASRGSQSDQRWRVYCHPVDTEGIVVVMDPVKLARYIRGKAKDGQFSCSDPSSHRACAEAIALSYLHSERTPLFGFRDSESSSAWLYRVIHSMSHLLIRGLGRVSGVEESSIAEMLFPSCGSFLLYVNQSGDFNLGTFSTCFENCMDVLLMSIRDRAEDCLYDPVCIQDSGGACPACLLIGEVSCENFNRDLSRVYLIGDRDVEGYWQG